MEAADRLAIINHGRLEQVGTPADMYDHPANEFVLTFLGPATCLAGEWPRLNDLVVHRFEDGKPAASAFAGTVARVTHLGFEIKVDVDLAGGRAAGSSRAAARPPSSVSRSVSASGWPGPTKTETSGSRSSARELDVRDTAQRRTRSGNGALAATADQQSANRHGTEPDDHRLLDVGTRKREAAR